MKLFSYITIFLLVVGTATAGPKKVLVEIFTNSHCPLCPAAHSTIDSYLQNGNNKNNVVYIYYHMPFPYSDDQLNLVNTADASARNNFYGTFSSTPHGVFNGQIQANNYSVWNGVLDGLAGDSPFEFTSKGVAAGNNLALTTTVKQTTSVNSNNLALYVIAVESVFYQGRNGIANHNNVMRKIFPGSEGRTFSNQPNQTQDLTESISISQSWNQSNLGFVVFIQDKQTKTVYQAEYISYNKLVTTDVNDEGLTIPTSFALEQNYPNPFNPSTVINYSLPVSGNVTLKIYDVVGREIQTLVNEFKDAGTYNFTFNTQLYALPSGMYYYRINTENFSETKKMILLK